MGKLKIIIPILILIIGLIVVINLINLQTEKQVEIISRQTKIPADAVKMTPKTDPHPPILHSDKYEEPIPLAVINTAGAEDSPFITPDGKTLYFFFTPDVNVPVEKQILDSVTGIYVSKYINGTWQEAERVMLQEPRKLALDGCEFVDGNIMWFCSAREGYTGLHWFSAEYKTGKWQNWKEINFPEDYKVGELHLYENELYYHSDRAGTKGNYDIWVTKKENNQWQTPENVRTVNTAGIDGWPFISENGKELWLSRQYLGTPAVYKSKKNNIWLGCSRTYSKPICR